LKIRNALATRLAAALFAKAMQGLFATLRLEYRTVAQHTNPYVASTGARFLYCVWHDSMIVPAFAGKHPHSAALTSHHQDGTFVACVLSAVGISAVRGSTRHGGETAVRQLMTVARQKHIVITPDGPRGPRRRMSRGIVFLASHTGRAIVPTAFACTRAWRIRGNWTDLMIPKPLAKVVLLAGAPICVPANLPPSELLDYVAVVQSAMDQLDEQAAQLVRGTGNAKQP
jgi:lysophospholipid acyltransferase (LPLAT)-like uncharacterized protein